MITMVCGVACGTVIMEIFSHKKFFRRFFTEEDDTGSHLRSYNIPLVGVVTKLELFANILGVLVAISWLLTKNWMLNNLLGLCMCFVFLKTLRLNKIIPGIILLSMLFFYDIFWVFGSKKFTKNNQSVMITVATGFDAPIKIMMP